MARADQRCEVIRVMASESQDVAAVGPDNPEVHPVTARRCREHGCADRQATERSKIRRLEQ
jgi:hypothetical protein